MMGSKRNRNRYSIMSQALPALSEKEEKEAFASYHKETDPLERARIAEGIMRSNLGSVLSIVNRIFTTIGGSQDEMINIGAMKVLSMVATFDPTRKLRFVNYYGTLVYKHVFAELYNMGQVEFPKKWISLKRKIEKSKSIAENKRGRSVDLQELIGEMGAEEEAFYLFILSMNYESIDNEDNTISSFISNNQHRPDEELEDKELKEYLRVAVGRLPSPCDVAVSLAYGINGTTPLTNEQIGRLLDTSTETARRARIAGLSILKEDRRLSDLL